MAPTELFRRLQFWLNRDAVTRDLEEEMRLHVEMRAEQMRDAPLRPSNQQETASADIRNDPAYAAARKRFGNTTTLQQRSRDMWGLAKLEELSGDLRFAFRRLLQQRAFSLSVVAVMAIGIGAVTAMFSAVDAAMLRPLPFKQPEQLVAVGHFDVPFDAGPSAPTSGVHQLDLNDLRTMPALFSDVAAYASGALNLVDPDHPHRIKVGVVTTNFFSLLGIQSLRGRVFSASESTPNAPSVVVLSYGLWQRQYGGRDITGLTVQLGTSDYEVVGVMPQGFSFPTESELWVPMSVPITFTTLQAFRGYIPSIVIGRLATGVSPALASTQLTARLDQWYGTLDESRKNIYKSSIANAHTERVAIPLQEKLAGDRKTAMIVLLGATGLLLLIACVNVTNLLLSQASVRRRELAVRQVLGATRSRIVRQLLTESIVLSMTGALLGVLLAPVPLKMMRVLQPKLLAGVAPAELNLRVLSFAVTMALITGIVFGLWPAFRFSSESHGADIRAGGGHGSTAGNTGRVRRVLVSAELALTVMLLIGAGLMLRSFSVLMQRDSGLQTAHVGSVEMTLPATAGNIADRVRTLSAILTQLAATPGIQSAGAVNDLPLNGQSGISVGVRVSGAPPVAPNKMTFARYLFATRDYFPTMGISLLRGRLFTVADDSAAAKVAVISKKMAEDYWPGVDALGRTFTLGRDEMTVIGIVSNVRESKLENEGGPQMYLHLLSIGPSGFSVVARSSLSESALLARMTDAVRSVDRSQAIYNVRMMDDVIDIYVGPRRANTMLIGSFALLALILSVVGVFAVVSHGVAHRSRELGIRSALGATGSNLVRMLAGEMVLVTVLGVATGLAGAWALAKTLESLVYGVEVHDTITFMIVPFALLLPVVLATLIPARRATKVNPSEVLRAD